MNNAQYWIAHSFSEEEISFLLPHLGPLLKLISTENKNDLADLLAQSYAYKITSCETLTTYAIQEMVKVFSDHLELPSHVSNVSRMGKMQNIPAAALSAFDSVPQAPPGLEKSETLPAKKLIDVFLGHETKVWYRVILVTLFCCPTGGDPPRRDRFAILTEEQKIKILKAYINNKNNKANLKKPSGPKPKKHSLSNDLKRALGGGSTHPCKIALHDLFHYLGNHSKNLPAVCEVLGPSLFTPLDTRSFVKYIPVLNGKSDLLVQATKDLMLYFIKNRNKIFSARKREYEGEIAKALHNFSPAEFGEIKRRRLKQHLRHFFELRDPLCKRIVVPLFEYYEFEEIARGILAKYRLLPYGWKAELESISGSGIKTGFDPFASLDMREPSTGAEVNYGAVQGSYFHDTSDDKQAPGETPNDVFVTQKLTNNGQIKFLTKYLAKNRIRYLSENTVHWNDSTSVKTYAPDSNMSTKIDRIVDEFIRKQKSLLLTLKTFYNSYVNEAIAISRGDLGQEAQAAFGMSFDDVRSCFKNNFDTVITAQEKFVTMFEILLVCKNAKPRQKYATYGRAGILFLLFSKCERIIIKGFENYNVNYALKTEILAKNDALVGKLPPNPRFLNYVKLFEEIATTKKSMTELKLGTVLYMPIQVVPQYKIFLERILKNLGGDYLHKDVGQRAIRVAEAISTSLDNKLRMNKGKMKQLLGS